MTTNLWVLEIEELTKLENNEKWIESVQLLEKKLLDSDNKENYLVRLIFQCWYILNETFIFDYSEKDYNYISLVYSNSMNNYLNINKSDYQSKLLIGYILSVNPLPLEPYDYWENKGFEFIKDSYTKLPDIPLAKRIYDGCNVHNALTDSVIDNNLEDYFSNQTAIERYFLDVFSK